MNIPRHATVTISVLSLALASPTAGCRQTPTRSATAAPAPPPTARRPVTDSYHAVSVTENYRWLENPAAPEVRDWMAAQNRHTRAALDRIPGRAALARRLTEILSAASTSYQGVQHRSGVTFALRRQPGAQQSVLVSFASADDPASARVVLDPNVVDPSGQTSIVLYRPSHSAQRIAVALARDGSEVGVLHFYEVASGREIGETIDRVNNPTGGGSVEWNADDSGVYYTRYPRAGERPAPDLDFYQQVYFHTVGHPEREDRYEIGRDLPRIAEIELDSSHDGRWLLASVANGDGGEFAHYLLGPTGGWTQITRFEDHVARIEFSPDGALFLLSHQGAPRGRVLRMTLANPQLASAVTAVETSDGVIRQIVPTDTRLYVVDLLGGPSQVRVFDHDGHALGQIPVQPFATVRGMVHTSGDSVMYRGETYLTVPAWYRIAFGAGAPVATALRDDSPVRFDDAEVVNEHARSRDGKSIPVMIIRRRGTRLDGTNPTLLGGYGGYGVSMVPSFSPANRVWLDRGGVIAIAILRGGGEFGEEWHLSGNLTHKQNVFDDFIAVAEHMISAGYTTPARLAIRGRSNGGLLMGAVLTQRPELFRAVYSGVGIYDMLRVELDPNGAFNVTEFGSVRDAEQFRALYAYSPYHRVRDGAAYPAVLMTTGEHDGRVNPAHSRKMIARLQAASSSGRPILLRTNAAAGHGAGTSQREWIAEETDTWSFLFEQLGMTAR